MSSARTPAAGTAGTAGTAGAPGALGANCVTSATGAPAEASDDTLARLATVIESRRPAAGGDPGKSYVARLFSKGTDAILKKVGEEATEVVMAAKDGDRTRLIAEVADLWFHSMIALAHLGARPADVLAELARREGLSGLEEMALRKAVEREGGRRSPGSEGGALSESSESSKGGESSETSKGSHRPARSGGSRA